MKNILSYIPGFRSNTKWKIVIALLYYAFSLIMLAAGVGAFLFFLAAPFAIFYTVKLFKIKSKLSAIIMTASIILMVAGIGISPNQNTSTKNMNVATSNQVKNNNQDNKDSNEKSIKQNTSTSADSKDATVTGQLKVHYIDVGQGDSILVQHGDKNMLIDTGTNASTNSLMSYLQKQNIKKLDYLVLTHPHEDHIGGADAVIKAFDIGTVYMPKVTTTTKTFKDVVAAMQAKGLKATSPNPGDTFKFGDASCTILGSINSNKDDLNTYSIVLKLAFGDNKFLFTGDAQTSNEQDMINKGYDLSADVLKVGHHGSYTSTSDAFLDKVNPKYAVISCGKGNDYGHPHKETMDKLQAKSIPVYRTDECGTIVCTSDGKNISFNVKPGDYKYGSDVKSGVNNNSSSASISNKISTPSSQKSSSSTSTSNIVKAPSQTQVNSDKQNITVYITKTGKKYHRAGCRYLSRSQIPISLKEAEAEGYQPCSVCNPPQ